jgi:hypothetical protein
MSFATPTDGKQPRVNFLTDPVTSRDLFGVVRGKCTSVSITWGTSWSWDASMRHRATRLFALFGGRSVTGAEGTSRRRQSTPSNWGSRWVAGGRAVQYLKEHIRRPRRSQYVTISAAATASSTSMFRLLQRDATDQQLLRPPSDKPSWLLLAAGAHPPRQRHQADPLLPLRVSSRVSRGGAGGQAALGSAVPLRCCITAFPHPCSLLLPGRAGRHGVGIPAIAHLCAQEQKACLEREHLSANCHDNLD